MSFCASETIVLDSNSTNVDASPIASALITELVTARTGHIPSNITNTGFSSQSPLRKVSALLASVTFCNEAAGAAISEYLQVAFKENHHIRGALVQDPGDRFGGYRCARYALDLPGLRFLPRFGKNDGVGNRAAGLVEADIQRLEVGGECRIRFDFVSEPRRLFTFQHLESDDAPAVRRVAVKNLQHVSETLPLRLDGDTGKGPVLIVGGMVADCGRLAFGQRPKFFTVPRKGHLAGATGYHVEDCP